MATLTANGPRSSQDSEAVKKASDYIASELLRYGYQVSRETVVLPRSTAASKQPFFNLVAEKPVHDAAEPVLELGAHYDSVPDSPGADDNASGVAALLEIARVTSTAHLGKRLRFCFFALEESGGHGSKHHVSKILSDHEPVAAAIILEMVGYTSTEPGSQDSPLRIPLLFSPPRTGNFIAVVSNLSSGTLGNRIESATERYTPTLPYFSANRTGGLFRDAMRSDHKFYWQQGIRAVMLTDTANFRNPHYHEATDTAESLDYAFLKRVSQAVAATALSWAN